MFKYGAFSGPNTGKYGPEKTPYLDTFHAVFLIKGNTVLVMILKVYLTILLIFLFYAVEFLIILY